MTIKERRRRTDCLLARMQQSEVRAMSNAEYERVLAETVMPEATRVEYAARFPFLHYGGKQ